MRCLHAARRRRQFVSQPTARKYLMVSVVQLHPQPGASASSLAAGLAAPERALIARALEFAEPLYAGQRLSTGEPAWSHALGLAASLAAIGLDAPGRAAGILFASPKYLEGIEKLRDAFGEEVAALAGGVELYQLRVATRGTPREQNEVLRKMVLGMVEDVRVVLIRLASRTQTLRYFSKSSPPKRFPYARETLDIYAPLANRLGVWQLKWELEDLSFRFLEPELYKRIAQMLDEKRLERERYIANAMETLARELGALHIIGQITGRPKHIYSIWNKMRTKQLDFSELYDVRALRVIVPEVKDCYAALGVVHNLWQPIPRSSTTTSRAQGALPVAAHRGGRPGRQDPRGSDPYRGDASPGRVRRRRALAIQGRRQSRRSSSTRRWPGCGNSWHGATRCRSRNPSSTTPSTCSRRRAR